MSSIDTPLTPSLLVSMPSLQDPYFEKTVILLCEFTKESAFGVIINRPSPIRVRDLTVKDSRLEPQGESPILIGGPVQPDFFWAIHSHDFSTGSTTHVDLAIYFSSMQEVLDGIVQGKGPEKFHLGRGYSGWGPGQLDKEIKEGAWWLAPTDEELVLSLPYHLRWEVVLKSIGIDPQTMGGSVIGEA